MTCSLKNTLRKIKDTSQDFGRSVYDNINTGLKKFASINSFSDEDIRQYEKLVFMKKYPFLDIQKLEMKYSPAPSKDVRHSANLYLIRNIQHDPSICEPPADVLNVEITNRGLTGFAIPLYLSKNVIVDNKSEAKLKNSNSHEFPPQKTENVLQSLKDDVKAYIDNKPQLILD